MKCEKLKIGSGKQSVKKRFAVSTSPKHLIRSKLRAPGSFGWLASPKKAAHNHVYNSAPSNACYIATIYGDFNAWQVKRLRQYRDNVLAAHMLGLIFIFLYYRLSPYFVILFKDIRPLNDIARKLLDVIAHKISAQSMHDNVL